MRGGSIIACWAGHLLDCILTHIEKKFTQHDGYTSMPCMNTESFGSHVQQRLIAWMGYDFTLIKPLCHRSIAVHPSLPYILSSSDDMLIKLWDWEKGWTCNQIFEGHSHYVMQVVFALCTMQHGDKHC